MYYPWTVCDYPLAQAVEDRIVKSPLIVTKEDDPKQPKHDPDQHHQKQRCREVWILAACCRPALEGTLERLQKAEPKPVLFIMAEKNVFRRCDGRVSLENQRVRLSRSPKCSSFTLTPKAKLQKRSRQSPRSSTRHRLPDNKIKAIVSVMMLREGWDVRNVSVVLGLRPFTAKAEILARASHRSWIALSCRDKPGPDADA